MDNHHVNIQTSAMSCGVLTCNSFGEDSRKILFAMASRLYHPSRGYPAAIYLWSDLSSTDSRGNRLANFIEDQQLGANLLTSQDHIENPVTGNEISLFTWIIPHEEFKEWYKKERLNRIKLQR